MRLQAEGNYCHSCGAQIAWVQTIAGKWMPLDPDPRDDGNVRLDKDGVAFVGNDMRAADPPTYVSHFATCTHPQRHRKR